MTSFLLFLFQQSPSDPISNKIWGVIIAAVVGQMVVGAFFIIGFVAVVRKSIDKDIPAQLQSLDKHLQDLARELLQMRREVDKHGYQIQSLEDSRKSMQGDLDDTRSRRYPNPRG